MRYSATVAILFVFGSKAVILVLCLAFDMLHLQTRPAATALIQWRPRETSLGKGAW
jgi:hypothetical protein